VGIARGLTRFPQQQGAGSQELGDRRQGWVWWYPTSAKTGQIWGTRRLRAEHIESGRSRAFLGLKSETWGTQLSQGWVWWYLSHICQNRADMGHPAFRKAARFARTHVPNCRDMGHPAFRKAARFARTHVPNCRDMGHPAFRKAARFARTHVPNCRDMGHPDYLCEERFSSA
jgi:hypothetical protein